MRREGKRGEGGICAERRRIGHGIECSQEIGGGNTHDKHATRGGEIKDVHMREGGGKRSLRNCLERKRNAAHNKGRKPRIQCEVEKGEKTWHIL